MGAFVRASGSKNCITAREAMPASGPSLRYSLSVCGMLDTPLFFVNGRRHYGSYDVATLTVAVTAARGRARLAAKA